MKQSNFCYSFMYTYSERPGTLAAKKLQDDVSEEDKSKRLTRIIEVQNELSKSMNHGLIGQTVEVLVESEAKRGNTDWKGRSDESIKVIFPKENYVIGDLVQVKITKATTTTLIGVSV